LSFISCIFISFPPFSIFLSHSCHFSILMTHVRSTSKMCLMVAILGNSIFFPSSSIINENYLCHCFSEVHNNSSISSGSRSRQSNIKWLLCNTDMQQWS
jgi:hypothetical protein